MWQAKGASHGRLQTGDGNNGSPATKTGGAISSVVCSLDRKQTQRGYFKPGILTATGLGKEPIPTAKGSTKQTNSKNCNLPKVNADGFGGGEPQTAESVTYGGGLFEAAKADAQQTGTHIATLKTATDHKHKIWKNAFMTMDALDKLDTSQHDIKTDDNTPAAELEQAVTAILSEPKNRGQQTPQTNTLRLFAKPISKRIEKFIENFEKHPLKNGDLGVTQDTRLGDITGVPTLTKLLLRVTLAVTQTKDKLENELATRKPDEDVKATGEKQKECNKHHASQHDCDSKDFCTYDKAKDEGKRCVYNKTKV
ncbi:variant surface glycoprotein (VSG), putative [Trypanosoma equiperdum]|uniref:Variant surface glycoprotein (VSG), putative n=1 Tax=Trypanosoma equiperdum TaxID=5694 RepID=A0A1G4IKF2_TRYEQ|nr:variant surface glycoprotein (VSG), putative [Trypanosoma equiperdum]